MSKGATINGKSSLLLMCLLCISAVFASCRAFSGESELPTPTHTPTPLSTALPEIATAVPAGLPSNPLEMYIRPVDLSVLDVPESTAEVDPDAEQTEIPAVPSEAELELEAAILNATNVTVDIIPVSRPADALAALCTSAGDASAVWVDGVAFSAALASNCGEPVYIVRKEINGRMQRGEAGVIVLNSSLGSSQVGALNGRVYCRLGIDDFYSWLLPLMVFRASNIDILNFDAIVDYEDVDSMIEAVVAGDCSGAGLSEVVYNQMLEDDEELADSLRVAITTPQIPYAVLMYPVEMQLGIRISLTDGLLELAEDDDGAELLFPFLGQDELERVDLDDFSDYSAFLDLVRLDFSILGS